MFQLINDLWDNGGNGVIFGQAIPLTIPFLLFPRLTMKAKLWSVMLLCFALLFFSHNVQSQNRRNYTKNLTTKDGKGKLNLCFVYIFCMTLTYRFRVCVVFRNLLLETDVKTISTHACSSHS